MGRKKDIGGIDAPRLNVLEEQQSRLSQYKEEKKGILGILLVPAAAPPFGGGGWQQKE